MFKLQNRIINAIKKNIINIILVFALTALAFLIYYYFRNYYPMFKGLNTKQSIMKVRTIIKSYGKFGVLAFLVMQIFQVVIFFIPGEVVQIAGGYVFGTVSGTLISFAGITIGSMITYCIAYLLGKAFVDKIIPKEKMLTVDKYLKKGKINHIILVLYLIPGLPKDIVGYICGISEINIRDFFIYSSLGRFPCILISAFFGARIFAGNKVLLIILALVMIVLAALGVFRGEKIINKFFSKK